VDKLWLVKGLRKLLFYHVRQYVDPPATGPGSRSGEFADFTPTFFIENLREMIRSARASGARVAVLTLATVVREDMTVEELRAANVIFPYFPSAYAVGDFLDLVGAYNRAIRRVALEEQVPIIDIDRVLGARPDSRSLFFDTMHTVEAGNEVIASAVLRVLEEEGLLGQQDEPPGARRELAPEPPGSRAGAE
jgi:lysophospholipase L1-like esterase